MDLSGKWYWIHLRIYKIEYALLRVSKTFINLKKNITMKIDNK